jgi:hypothetical protein
MSSARFSRSLLLRLHAVHSPANISALSALGARVPHAQLGEHVELVERCLIHPSFWDAVDELQRSGAFQTGPGLSRTREEEALRRVSVNVRRSGAGAVVAGALETAPTAVTAAESTASISEVEGESEGERKEEAAVSTATVPTETRRHTNFWDQQRAHNGPLEALGNSLLGLLATEWIEGTYPYLPSR